MNYYNVLDYYEISVIATVNKYYNNENIAVILNNIAKDYFTNIMDWKSIIFYVPIIIKLMSTYNESTEGKPKSSNEVFIGKKPLMTYVTATLVQLANEPTVFIKARGKSIPMAVDVSQIIVKRMNTLGYKVSSVKIGSEVVKSQDGNNRNVSTIEVAVSRNSS